MPTGSVTLPAAVQAEYELEHAAPPDLGAYEQDSLRLMPPCLSDWVADDGLAPTSTTSSTRLT